VVGSSSGDGWFDQLGRQVRVLPVRAVKQKLQAAHRWWVIRVVRSSGQATPIIIWCFVSGSSLWL
jgi:hypothetical protein